MRELVLAGAIVCIMLVISLFRPDFINPGNLRDILESSALTVIVACGMTAVIITAQIDISVSATLAVAAVLAGLAAARGAHPLIALLIAACAGAVIGGLNGFLTARLRIPSIVATLATMGALRGILVLTTRGDLIEIAAPVRDWGSFEWLGFAPHFWLAGVIALATGLALARTKAGRRLYATGSNPHAAELSGIPVTGVTWAAFVLVGALAGLAGFFLITQLPNLNPAPLPGFELEVITAVVVGGTDIFGGRGTIFGAVLAALLLSTITVALTFMGSFVQGMRSEFQPAVQGLLILAAVLYTGLAREKAPE